MDNTLHPKGFGGNLCSLNAFAYLNKVQSGTDHCIDTTLRLDSLGCSTISGCPCANKRKRNVTEHGFSLALGPRGSPTYSDNSKMSSITTSTMSSAKQTDIGSSMNLELDCQLHLGNGSDVTHNFKKSSLAPKKVSESEPLCDLQLSLSAGPSTSVITNASILSNKNQNNLEMFVSISGVPPVDEGSTSSRWKSRVPSLLPFHRKPSANGFVITWEDTRNDPAPSMQNLLSIPAQAPKCSVTCTSGVTHTQQQCNTSTKICQFQGCGKGARGASGLCIAHGGGRRCQKEGCHKGAEGRTSYCKAHGGGRRCQSFGCTKSAEGRTNFCIAHGGGRRCSHKDCPRAARGKSGLCIRHGGGKRCQKENCTKSAEGYSGLCISHGGGRRCQFPSCSKGAQGSTMFCKAHGGGKRCTAPGCTKGAEGSTSFCKGHGGGKRCSFQGGGICPKSVHGGTQFCVAHGGGKRCAVPECTKSARGRTDFCVRHGGGRRCKSDGCGKSAQGRTNFCKAHGGGKRCSWGLPGFDLGTDGLPCDRFARGKSGLCTAHSTLVQDHALHKEGSPPSQDSQDVQYLKPEKIKEVSVEDDVFAKTGNHGWKFTGRDIPCQMPVHQSAFAPSGVFTLPEGRVHGGSLMAMLATNAALGSHSNGHIGDGSSEQHTTSVTPRKWL